MTIDTAASDLEQRALARVRLKTGFLIHALVFVLVNAALYVAMLVGHGRGPGLAFWGWGLGLTIHGVVVLARLNGDGMRQRMLQKEIEHLRRRERQ